MAGAGYRYDETFVVGESVEFTWGLGDTSVPFPFADYTHEYALAVEPGCPVASLTVGDGITVDTVESTVTFRISAALPAGRYEHAYRIRHAATDAVIPVFDGSITIRQGAFP